jgi:hypothetical protein
MVLKRAIIAHLILLCSADTPERKSFSILSIDGGGVRGIIPAKVIKNLEEFAYKYVT